MHVTPLAYRKQHHLWCQACTQVQEIRVVCLQLHPQGGVTQTYPTRHDYCSHLGLDPGDGGISWRLDSDAALLPRSREVPPRRQALGNAEPEAALEQCCRAWRESCGI